MSAAVDLGCQCGKLRSMPYTLSPDVQEASDLTTDSAGDRSWTKILAFLQWA